MPFALQLENDALYDVIFEIFVPRAASGDVVEAYARLDADYQTLAMAVGDEIKASGQGSILDAQRPAIAPYLFARLLGSSVNRVATANAGLLVRISPNTSLDQDVETRVGLMRVPPPSSRLGTPERGFIPADLISDTLAEPLGSRVRKNPNGRERVIIHLDVQTEARMTSRAAVVRELLWVQARLASAVDFDPRSQATYPYVFATMTGYAILALVDLDRNPLTAPRGIFRIWEDSKVQACITETVATVKADAAHVAFGAVGDGIVWALLDSGIDKTHPHFAHYHNLTLPGPLAHKDCRRPPSPDDGAIVAVADAVAGGAEAVAAVPPPVAAPGLVPADPVDESTEDVYGHGTHVAGIIAGAMSTEWNDDARPAVPGQAPPKQAPVAVVTTRNEVGAQEPQRRKLEEISGMAPRCTLLSLRVLDDDGTGNVSSLIEAIDQIQQWNDFGRHLAVHGVNMSLGYPFEAEWFACGQSPLCIEVNQLVAAGVVVVVAAGNAGYGYAETEGSGAISHGIEMSITDPGNSDLAITVGSTHRTAPHQYGVSYFSSKGPTGDGRMKPDLLGPGERIISCASTQSRGVITVVQSDKDSPTSITPDQYTYKEDSGTSMAAPHVSGVIAAFLSIRREYIGRPREVKALFMAAATDLGRDRAYQGAGLVDLMRTIQSV